MTFVNNMFDGFDKIYFHTNKLRTIGLLYKNEEQIGMSFSENGDEVADHYYLDYKIEYSDSLIPSQVLLLIQNSKANISNLRFYKDAIINNLNDTIKYNENKILPINDSVFKFLNKNNTEVLFLNGTLIFNEIDIDIDTVYHPMIHFHTAF